MAFIIMVIINFVLFVLVFARIWHVATDVVDIFDFRQHGLHCHNQSSTQNADLLFFAFLMGFCFYFCFCWSVTDTMNTISRDRSGSEFANFAG